MASLEDSVAKIDAAAAKFEELEPCLEGGFFLPRTPGGRRLAGFFVFNGLGAGLLAAYKLGNLDASLVNFALAAHAVGLVFFIAWLLALRKVWRLLDELRGVIKSDETSVDVR